MKRMIKIPPSTWTLLAYLALAASLLLLWLSQSADALPGAQGGPVCLAGWPARPLL